MKLRLLLFWILALTCTTRAQEAWRESNISGTPTGVWSISACKNTLYASSWNSIFQSSDGGITWKRIVLENETIPKEEIFEGKYKSDPNGTFYFYSDKSLYRLTYGSDTAQLLLSFDFYAYRSSSLSLSHDGKTVVFYNGHETWVSHDYGAGWKQIELDDEYKLDLELQSVTYDEKYGIIKNYSTKRKLNTAEISYYVFYSNNDGLVWYQLDTIPGTSIPIEVNIEVVDSSLWIVDGNTYNFRTKRYNSLIDKEYRHFFKTPPGYVIVTDLSVWYSDDDGATWSQMKTEIFDEYSNGWVDAFYADSAGTLYAGSRYDIMKKSTDNGLTWTSMYLTTSRELEFFVVKNTSNQVHAFDRRFNRYSSQDNGASWSAIPFPTQQLYVQNYDINTKGEIVYESNKINYSPDNGITWSAIPRPQGASFSTSKSLQILDNSEIIAYGARYSKAEQKFNKLDVHADNLTLLKSGQYLSFDQGHLYLLNSELTTEEHLDRSIDTKIGYSSSRKCYAISNSQSVYVGTEKGLFKSAGVSDSFTLIAFPDQSVDQIFVDDNGYLYVRSGTAIYTSKNDGKTWLSINSNLGTESIQDIYAFGDCKIIAKSNSIYYIDLKDAKFLTLTDSISGTDLYFNDTVTYTCTVRDNNNIPVASAGVVLYNSITHTFDTVMTDSKGTAVRKITMSYYNQNLRQPMQFLSYSFKSGFYQSSIQTQNVTYHSEKKNLRCTAPNYVIAAPGSQAGIPVALSIVPAPGLLFTKGVLYIHNEYKGVTDTIPYDGIGEYTYSFDITPNAKFGIYKLVITGKNEQNELTTARAAYVIISDSIQWYSSGNVDEVPSPLLVLYPNPASEFIVVDIPESVRTGKGQNLLEIFSLDGTRVLVYSPTSSTGSTSERIDISGLPAGVYCIKINALRTAFIKQ